MCLRAIMNYQVRLPIVFLLLLYLRESVQIEHSEKYELMVISEAALVSRL